MTDHRDILRTTKSILLIDYPGRIVPDTLARAGFDVVAHEGPGPDEYHTYGLTPEGEITKSQGGPAPDHADLVFSHRPVDELPPIADEAKRIGARAVWLHSGQAEGGGRDPRGCWLPDGERANARAIVEGVGLVYLDEPFILDVAADVGGPAGR